MVIIAIYFRFDHMHFQQRESGYCARLGLVVLEDLLDHEDLRENRDYFASFSFQSLDLRFQLSWENKGFIGDIIPQHL